LKNPNYRLRRPRIELKQLKLKYNNWLNSIHKFKRKENHKRRRQIFFGHLRAQFLTQSNHFKRFSSLLKSYNLLKENPQFTQTTTHKLVNKVSMSQLAIFVQAPGRLMAHLTLDMQLIEYMASTRMALEIWDAKAIESDEVVEFCCCFAFERNIKIKWYF